MLDTSWKNPFRRMRTAWESSVKGNLFEMGCEDDAWIEMVQVRVQWWSLVLPVMD
jgi:hypothetical protein